MNTIKLIQEMFGGDVLKQYLANKKVIEIPNTDRVSLADLLRAMDLDFGAEVGVERGLYSAVLLDHNPDLFLHSIDAWTAYHGYRDHVSQSKMNQLLEDAKDNLRKYQNRNILVKKFSVDAAKDFKDGALDFVYLDGNHEYVQVVNDLGAWDPKVRIGGIVAGHDYIRRKNNGYLMHVIPAVNGFVESYEISPLFILGRKDRRPGEKRDTARSWFYIKQSRGSIKPGFEP